MLTKLEQSMERHNEEKLERKTNWATTRRKLEGYIEVHIRRLSSPHLILIHTLLTERRVSTACLSFRSTLYSVLSTALPLLAS